MSWGWGETQCPPSCKKAELCYRYPGPKVQGSRSSAEANNNPSVPSVEIISVSSLKKELEKSQGVISR
jgi:hypothetical protein